MTLAIEKQAEKESGLRSFGRFDLGDGRSFFDLLRRLAFGTFGEFACFFFLHQSGALANSFAQIGELGTADGSLTFHLDLVHTRGIDWEHSLNTFAITDPAHGEGGV